MSKNTEHNLVICIMQLLITQALSMCYFASAPLLYDRFETPIIFGYVAPLTLFAPGFYFRPPPPLMAAAVPYAIVLFIDLIFLSVMTWSIARNHKVVSAIALFLFNFIGIGMIASQAV